MQLWFAICLAGLALTAPVEPNVAGTLEAREPRGLMPSAKMRKRSEDALQKREPILLPNHPSVTGGESTAAADEQAAEVEKREPRRDVRKLNTMGGHDIKLPNGEIFHMGPERRDVVNEQAAEVEKREPKRTRNPKIIHQSWGGSLKDSKGNVLVEHWGPQRRDVTDEQTAEVEKREPKRVAYLGPEVPRGRLDLGKIRIGRREPSRRKGESAIPERMPNHDVVNGQTAEVQKREPKKGGPKPKFEPIISIPAYRYGPQRRDVVDGQAAEVEKREPKRASDKVVQMWDVLKLPNGKIVPWGPQRRDVVDEQAAEVEKRFISISKPLHGIAPAYRRIRT